MNRKIPDTIRNFTAVWNFTAVQDAIRNVMVGNFLSLVAHHGAPGPWCPTHCPGNLQNERAAQLAPVVRPMVAGVEFVADGAPHFITVDVVYC